PKSGAGMCKHPKYGQWHPRCVGTWPEAMEARGNYLAAVLLATSDDPAAQLAAEDAKDYAIAEAQFGANWAYDKHLKQMYYYFYVDFPIPGYVPIWKGGKWAEPREKVALNGWYTRWWPDPFSYGYNLGGGKEFRDMAMEVLIQGRNRDYWTLPKAPDDAVQGYANISWNTKGDWVSPCSLTFGVCARPRKDEEGPKAVTDLAAKALGDGKVELSWTAPADQGGGKVALYQVKYAGRLIKDYPYTGEDWRRDWRDVSYWNMVSNVLGEPTPGKPGTKEKMTLEGLEAGKKLHFAMRSEDDGPNRSPMSNVVEAEVK
ncbi:fibronectin type III domain-containing protein, partial [Planctomycetota bacterium]